MFRICVLQRKRLKHAMRVALLGACCFLGMGVGMQVAHTQSNPGAASPAATLASSPISVATSGIRWSSLTEPQKTALAPLQETWETLTEGHQRKWIALSQNFSTLSTEDRQRLHERMLQWAALKPKERQQARLNFASTKKIPASERSSNWDAYQALSPEEKAALAQKASPKPAGAAIATKPPAPEKLTPVPLTRNSSDAEREKRATQQTVDRKTLLPVPSTPKTSNPTN